MGITENLGELSMIGTHNQGQQVPPTEAGQTITFGTVKLILSVVGVVLAILFCMERMTAGIRTDIGIIRNEVSQLRTEMTSLVGRVGKIEGILEQQQRSARPDSGAEMTLNRLVPQKDRE